MPLLEYDISIVGTAGINRAFQAIEARAAQHNTRMQQMFGGSARPRSAGQATATAAASRAAQERAEVTSAAKVARAREREELGAQRRITRERERAEKQMFSLRMRHLRQEDAERKRAEAATVRERQRLNSHLMGTAGRSASGAVRGAVGFAAGSVGLVGGFAAGNAVRNELSLNRRYRELAVNSRPAGQDFVVDPTTIGSAVSSESIRTGTNREDVLAGLENYVQKTGDIKAAVANLKNFSDFALAFKSTTGDIATAAATIQQQFGISDANDVAQALTAFGLQGRSGAFELVDLASELPQIGAAGARFGLQGVEGAKVIGGLSQLAIQSTGSAPEAATAVKQMFNQLQAKATQIQSGKAFGGREKVDVYEGGDTTAQGRDIRDVLTEVIAASGGRQDELLKIFDVRGVNAVSQLATAFKDANLAAGGGEAGKAAGIEAVRRMLDESIETTGKFSDIQNDVAIMMEDDSVKVSQAMQELEIELGQAFLPAVREVTKALQENMPAIKDFAAELGHIVSYLAENPFKGIGTLIGAKVIAEIAAAGIAAKGGALLGGIGAATSVGGVGAALGLGGGAAVAAGGLVTGAAAAAAGYLGYNGVLTAAEMFDKNLGDRELSFGNAVEDIQSVDGFDWEALKQTLGLSDQKSVAEMIGKLPDGVKIGTETANALEGKTLKVEVTNADALAGAQAMNRTNSPTNPR